MQYYNRINSASRLQSVVDFIASEFDASGLLGKDHDRDTVKLHVTLMNTLFRQDKSGADEWKPGKGKKKRETFNATSLLQVATVMYFNEKCSIIVSIFHLITCSQK